VLTIYVDTYHDLRVWKGNGSGFNERASPTGWLNDRVRLNAKGTKSMHRRNCEFQRSLKVSEFSDFPSLTELRGHQTIR
jgi:hypothetical protein